MRQFQRRPGVVDANVQPVLDAEQVYPGRWCIALVNAWAYSNSGNNGVSFGLIHLQVLDDAERFGAQVPKAESVFKPVAVAKPVKPAADVNSFLN